MNSMGTTLMGSIQHVINRSAENTTFDPCVLEHSTNGGRFGILLKILATVTRTDPYTWRRLLEI